MSLSWSRRHWARDEIDTLNVERDWLRIAQLSFCTRYGTPVFLHGLFSMAFVLNVGMPAMATILYREGRGPIVRDTRRRNFDSLTFFGELYRHGDSPRTRAIAARLVQMHSRFPISNDMSLYTLATLCCLPQRLSQRFLPQGGGISDKEVEAQYRFWRWVGELLQIHDIPDSSQAMLDWMLAFERREMRPSDACTRISAALAQEWADYWFPRPLHPLARGLFYSLVEPDLRRQLALPEPGPISRALAARLVRGFFLAKRLLPDPAERYFSDYFGRRYGGRLEPQSIGYQEKAP